MYYLLYFRVSAIYLLRLYDDAYTMLESVQWVTDNLLTICGTSDYNVHKSNSINGNNR